MTDDSVLSSLQQVVGTRYNRTEYNRDLIDTYILRKARQKGIRLPTGGPPAEYKYLGAKVFDSTAGMSHNVVYIDVGSMYPSLLMSLNASPETVIGTQEDLDESQYTEDDCVWGYIDARPVKHLDEGTPKSEWEQYTQGQYKMVYDPHQSSVKWTCDDDDGPQYERLYFLDHDTQKGFLTECVEELIDLKNQYRGTSLYGSTKTVTNSIYGVLGFANEDSSFRLFDWRIAEAITLSGRKMIEYSAQYTLDELADRGYDDAYVALGDTDGCGIALPSASSRHEALDVIMDIVGEDKEELDGYELNHEGYDTLFQETFNVPADQHHGEIETEMYAPKVFIPADDSAADYPHTDVGVKKRRIEWQTWNDDDGETDIIDITGLEAERSDSMPVVKEAQELFAATLPRDNSDGKEWLFPQLRNLAEGVQEGSLDLTQMCKRGGIGQDLSEYGTSTRRAGPLYRGAKYANENIDGVTIQHGDKPAVVYVEKTGSYPSTYDADTAEDGDLVDAVSLSNPENLPSEFEVDYERHWQKFKTSMNPLLDTRGWPWSDVLNNHEQDSLQSFAVSD